MPRGTGVPHTDEYGVTWHADHDGTVHVLTPDGVLIIMEPGGASMPTYYPTGTVVTTDATGNSSYRDIYAPHPTPQAICDPCSPGARLSVRRWGPAR